jgi:hypothetical protein
MYTTVAKTTKAYISSKIRFCAQLLSLLLQSIFIMENSISILSQDEQLDLAVVYKTQNPLITIHKIAYTYGVPPSTLRHRIKGCRDVKTYYQDHQRLTVLEEASLVKWMT